MGAVIGWAAGKQSQLPLAPLSIDITRTLRLHYLFSLVFAIYVVFQLSTAWPLIQAAGGISHILSSGGNAYRAASLNQALADSQVGLSGGIIGPLVNYGTFIIGSLSIYTGAIVWKAGRRLVAIMPLLIGGALGLLTLQRTSIVLVFLLFAVGVWSLSLSGVSIPLAPRAGRRAPENRMIRRPRLVRTVASAVVALSVVGGFLYATTSARTSEAAGGSLLSTAGEYVVGGLAGLNSRSAGGPEWAKIPSDVAGVFDPYPGGGGYTFTGLWSVLDRLGLPVETTRVNLDFTPVTLFGESTITNVVSALGEFYLDFRMPGVVILSFLLGFGTAFFQRRMMDSRRVLLVPLVVFLLTFAFWSFFVAWTSDLRQILIAMVGGPILTWAVRYRTAPHTDGMAVTTPATIPGR
ncbi:O-antigen polymerase [Microbacterium sp. Mu-80]|uniref:O-antigen polymerase n=1 Tax=Microbacterium bandirmense TaxID=3122050 RepID=A0ABU8LEW4_9MICO